MQVASFSGLASGIQWRDMIDQIMAIESHPIDRIAAQKTAIEARASAWAAFRTRVQTVENAARALRIGTSLLSTRAAVSAAGPSPLSAQTTSSALPGSHAVSVLALASREKLGSDAVADRTAALGLDGEFVVNGRRVAIAANDSLDRIATLINQSNTGTSPSGVTASVMATAAGSYRLVLTATQTGAQGIRLADAGGDVLRGLGLVDDATTIRSLSSGAATGTSFASRSATVAEQLGLTGTTPTTVTINGQAVAIDLATDSLDDIAARIDQPAGPVHARVVTETVNGRDSYRLEISGTVSYVDGAHALETLGILTATRTSAAQQISSAAYSTTSGGVATGATSLAQLSLDGVTPLVQAGDTIQLAGTRPDGSTFTLSLHSTATLDDLVQALNGSTALQAGGTATATASLANGSLVVRDDVARDSLLALDITVVSATGQVRAGGLGPLTVDAGRTRVLTAGQDARLRIDGAFVTRSSNTIADVLPGVTFSLSALGDATVDVTRDAAVATDAVKTLVNAYNALSDFVAQQSTVPPGGTPPPLYSDPVLRNMRSSLRGGLAASVNPLVAGGITRLADIGIQIDRYGRFTTDEAKLQDVLATRPEDVARFFGLYAETTTSSLVYRTASNAAVGGTYAVDIQQAATRAVVIGSLAPGVTINPGDRLVLRDRASGRDYSVDLHGLALDQIAAALQQELLTPTTRQILSSASLSAAGTALLTAAGAGINSGDSLTISGTRANGSAFLTSVQVGAGDTLDSLAARLQTEFQGDAKVRWTGSAFEVTSNTTGSSELTLTVHNETTSADPFGSFQITTAGRAAARITATEAGGLLTLEHADYGAGAGFDLWYEDASGTTLAGYDPLTLLTGPPASPGSHRGLDVVGTIGGVAATGSGRTLTGTGAGAEGLVVDYTGTAPGTSSITFSRGIGSLVERAASALLATGNGSIDAITKNLDGRLQTLTSRADSIARRLELRRDELIRRFTALEQAMSRAQSQSAWLTSQITRLENSTRK